jgi:hypothetical protein
VRDLLLADGCGSEENLAMTHAAGDLDALITEQHVALLDDL